MEQGTFEKSYRHLSPVVKWQLRFRWLVMRIFGPATILAGLARAWGWL